MNPAIDTSAAERAPGSTRRARPLDGIRALDLSRFIAGPYIGRLLADLGADVVKIEPPEGDVTRLFGVVRDGLAGLYVQENAGKRNVCIDLKAEGAAELVLDLAQQADVVIENFRPGVIDRLGIGWQKLAGVNPRLVLVSISGFGQAGPESQRQAYAPIIHAESGWVGRKAELLGEAPRDSVVSFADSIAGLHGMVALLSALYMRERTGEGQHLDISMLDAWHSTDDYVHYLLDGAKKPVLQGGEVFEAPGGLLMLNRTLPHVWKLLKDAYGIVSEEPAGADVATKERCRRQAIHRWMASFSDRDALKRALENANLAWGEVRTSATVLESPTVAAHGVAASVEDEEGNVRLVVQSPYRFSAADSGVAGPAPRLGQHDAQVLADWLGLGEAAIGSLRDRRILAGNRGRW
jgi:crotonobetainyl-CoA:carnitine CoA-transferase CaiB-like acyl-CoA transferase